MKDIKEYDYKRSILMKNLIKIGSGILAMGVLMTTGITVFATSDTDANMDVNSANTLISEESTNRRSMGRCNGGFGNMERPELTEDQKAEMEENMKERLAEQLEDGNITQEEYDQAISDIAEGKRPMFSGRGRGGFCNMERRDFIGDKK